jgi:type 1 glutamine amidotransferase
MLQMKILTFISILSLSILCAHADHHEGGADGFAPIFDGKSLNNWNGDPKFWSVQDGAITGQTTAQNPTRGNTFIIWEAGELDDFELKLKFKIEGGNSGIQIRSFKLNGKADEWRIGGYQSDFEAGDNWTGTIYGEQFGGVFAKRGQRVTVNEKGKKNQGDPVGDPKELNKAIKKGEWNEFHIIAKGYNIKQSINGTLMAEVTDNGPNKRRQGLLALQLHAGPPMKVQFKDIMLKRLKLEDAKKICFYAGTRSHGWGSHEHHAGNILLAKRLRSHYGEKVVTSLYKNGWPKDPTAMQNADALVMFCTGGGGHMAKFHLRQIDHYQKKGMGVGSIHYAVEIPKGKQGGDKFLDWMGGFFEAHWSVNPHWIPEFKSFPDHAVANGVQPFKINDEWYYHMRFRPDMKGITPILSALPGADTLKRGDGAHSGNPHVRASVLERKEKQPVVWATENENGAGRGFGFTGAHVHNNWADDNFRKVGLNAVAWIAGLDIPKNGIPSETPNKEELEANQDYPRK